ncbi:folate transporter 1, chloroplastic isoform X5 [Dendrobium catenatum]|uniref:folate transporter 1, chloroplastic isoform X2 n=1 Tax=Dendrobium catenatum TaxID=906689 RepID=UPI0009F63851|nr:folate transporter 1, chloroplastic isoform X2 [Dendrobium catenatum]XP_028551723.1 folate transporter 1, chloroplastic isoform X5 [Dendrobium catenatum]
MSDREKWNLENAAAGAIAGFSTVAVLHPLDVVRTRFQVSDGRGGSCLPLYKNTVHAIYSIARMEGLRGLYAGFYPAVFGSTVSWGLYFFFYSRAKARYKKGFDQSLSPGYHLVAAAEAGALACVLTNPIWLVKTRLQLQTPFNQNRPYIGSSDAVRTIFKEEGWRAFYKGIGSGLFLVSHAAIQFCAYEELRKIAINLKSRREKTDVKDGDRLLNSFDYAMLGGASKLAAILLTYPSQVIRARIQQRPSSDGIPKYLDSWHVASETARFEGARGFYRGITSSLLKNIPSASITFVMYENILKLFKLSQSKLDASD